VIEIATRPILMIVRCTLRLAESLAIVGQYSPTDFSHRLIKHLDQLL
jgi:hypothetical protein